MLEDSSFLSIATFPSYTHSPIPTGPKRSSVAKRITIKTRIDYYSSCGNILYIYSEGDGFELQQKPDILTCFPSFSLVCPVK